LVVQQAEAETDLVVKVGLKLFQELGERTKKLEADLGLYRDMVIQLAAQEGVDVPDFVKDESRGLGEEQAGQLREWLGQLRQLAAGEETTAGRASSRKRGRHGRVEDVEEFVDNKKYRFNGKHIYVTWSKSQIELKDEFHQKLLAILPAGVRLFGGRGLHQDGTPHYHVVFSFLHKVNWPDAAKKFSIEGDTNAIRFDKPKPRRRLSDFLEKAQSYCEKDGDTFGERLSLEGAVVGQRKRKRQNIVDEPFGSDVFKPKRLACHQRA
jgi:hypothetical protein